jgi:CRP-like cAMP-binding protein
MSVSCLVRNFSRYAELSDSDVAFLRRFEEKPEHYRAGTDVIVQGVPSDSLFVLSSGWCFVKYDQPDGSRQVLDVCHGGDIVGIRELCFQRAICGMQTLSDSVLCAFPKSYLSEMFSEHPRLAGILFLAGMRREALLIERVVNLGRRSAFARLCHFVTEMKQRVDHVNDTEGVNFEVPIPAPLLADILGMSEMHTYRMLKRMGDERLASFDNGHFDLHDPHGLRAAAGFREDYLLLDKSWLPAA